MQNLKLSSRHFLYIFMFCLAGCATSSYRIANRDGGKIELEVTPDRVLLQCEYASENKEVPYGFMIHVLDEQKTVLTAVQGNNLDERSCAERIKKINHILQTGKRIYIAGIGYGLDKPREIEEWQHTFPSLGTFNGNGRVLQFFAIANEHGACYEAYYGDRKPCPRGEFPITRRTD